MKIIDSVSNTTIKHLVSLQKKRERDASDFILVEGEHLIEEARNAGLLMEVYATQHPCDVLISDKVAQKLSKTQSGSTQFASVRKPKFTLQNDAKRVLVLDGLQDPGNVGTIVRTAHSFGFDAIYLTPECADTWSDKTIRSSQGAVFMQATYRADKAEILEILKEHMFHVYATDVHDAQAPGTIDASDKLAFVIGSEGNGVSEYFKNASDGRVKIETSRFESLNAAIATGILCYIFKQ